MDLIATSGGSIGIAKNTINIKSNAPEGYDLYLSMNNNQADGNRLYKDANPGTATSPNPYLSPTSGTWDNPAPLDTNSWGYALASTTTGLPASTTPFDTTYNPSAPNTNALFAAMPLQGQEQLIQTITTPDATNGIDTDIYYGVNANVSLPSGVYKGTVTYTAIARATTNTNSITAVSPSTTTKLEGGEPLTITTMLGVNAADAEDPGDPANGIPEKRVSVAIGGENCPITGLSNAQDGSLLIHCNSPAMDTGRYDVAVDIPKYDKFWVIVNGIQYKYTEQDQNSAINNAVGQVTGGNATAADILLGKTAYVGGVELTGTMPSYTVQYDATKTEQENTADAGLTWSADGSTLTIAEGYHTQQQVNSQSAMSITLLISATDMIPGAKAPFSATTVSNTKINATHDVNVLLNNIGVDHTKCTADNFLIVPKYVHGYAATQGGRYGSYSEPYITYDDSTGIVTVNNIGGRYTTLSNGSVWIAWNYGINDYDLYYVAR